jgi:hypothetical protein
MAVGGLDPGMNAGAWVGFTEARRSGLLEGSEGTPMGARCIHRWFTARDSTAPALALGGNLLAAVADEEE